MEGMFQVVKNRKIVDERLITTTDIISLKDPTVRIMAEASDFKTEGELLLIEDFKVQRMRYIDTDCTLKVGKFAFRNR